MYKITSMILTFEPGGHTYNGGKGISVSTLIGNYKDEFDEDFWLRWKSWEHILFPGDNKDVAKDRFRVLRKELGYSYDMMKVRSDMIFVKLAQRYPKLVEIVEEDIRETIKQKWVEKNKKSIETGSAYHDYMEKESFYRGYEVNPFDGKEYKVIKPYSWKNGIKTQELDFNNLEEGYYPEIILNMGSIFGQSDRVWVNKYKEIWVRDYKTNEEIKTENKFQKMKAPLSHLDDCEFNHYAIQLSMYGYILESKGYKVMGLGLDHFNNEITVPYMRKEVESIILDYEINQL